MKKLMFMSECSISDKVDNWMYRLHFNVLFLDRNNPKSNNWCKNELIYWDYEAAQLKEK